MRDYFFVICFLVTNNLFLIQSCEKRIAGQVSQSEPPVTDSLLPGGIDGDPDMGDTSSPGIFYDRFEAPLDLSRWDVMHRVWGLNANPDYQHGGVIRENVYTRDGVAVFNSLGDLYKGPLRGANGRSNRLGGAIVSKQRFGSGRYEAKMRIVQAPDMGVLSSFWTFWYKEISLKSDSAAYVKAIEAGNVPGRDADKTIILNHEIDIELLGKNLSTPYYSNWIGEKEIEYDTRIVPSKRLDDNQFHIYRFDWHTGGNGQTPRVEYYLDNELVHTSYDFVPYIAGHITIGNWFAWWAGATGGTYKAPLYDKKEMWVDWVKYTPFNEPNDDWQE